jgi:hypothetical protein
MVCLLLFVELFTNSVPRCTLVLADLILPSASCCFDQLASSHSFQPQSLTLLPESPVTLFSKNFGIIEKTALLRSMSKARDVAQWYSTCLA